MTPSNLFLYSFNGIPLFTYGMIGITTLVLAYVTITDNENSDNSEASSESSSVLPSMFTGEPAVGGRGKNRKTKHNKHHGKKTRKNN